MSGALFGSFLIGLREGLEATLVVTILVAFLVKSGRRNKLGQVWLGVAAAVVLSVAFGAVLTFVAEDLLGFQQKELFEAVASILAVVFVTWMIFWMRRFARTLATDLRGKLEHAIGLGTFAIVTMAFLAVAREGLETALLFYTNARGAADSASPLIGITVGVLTAVALGWLLYFGAIRINLSVFFKWTGLALILVAGGIFKYGVHDLQESGILPGLQTYAFDISGSYDGSTWYGALLTGMLNFTATPSVLEAIAWIGYVVPVLVLFLLPGRPAPASAPVAAAPTTPSSAAPSSTVPPLAAPALAAPPSSARSSAASSSAAPSSLAPSSLAPSTGDSSSAVSSAATATGSRAGNT